MLFNEVIKRLNWILLMKIFLMPLCRMRIVWELMRMHLPFLGLN